MNNNIIMKLVERKYPFVELMTYLESQHAQIILYRVSRKYRKILSLNLKFFQKNNNQGLNNFFGQIGLQYYCKDPNNLYATKKVLSELEPFSDLRLDLAVKIWASLEQKNENKFNPSLKIVKKLKFGKVSIKILTGIDTFYRFFKQIFAMISEFFSDSQQITFSIYFNQLVKDQITYALEDCLIYEIENLEIYSSDRMILSEKCLQKVKHVQINLQRENNLKFENLNIKYPGTFFSFYIISLYMNDVISTYLEYLGLFKTQTLQLSIYLYHILMDEQFILKQILKKFDKIEVILNQYSYRDQEDLLKMRGLQSQFRNLQIKNVDFNVNSDLTNFNGRIFARNVIMTQINQTSHNISFENFSKFKIKNSIDITLNAQTIIGQSNCLMECPEEIVIRLSKAKIDWEKQVADYLSGFCNCENSQGIHIYNEEHSNPRNPESLELIFNKLEHFKNLRKLSLPFSCDAKSIKTMKKTLEKQKNLVYLNILSYENSNILQDTIHDLSEFAIDKLKELRYFDIYVNETNHMREVKCSHRANPLTITINHQFDRAIQCFIDTRLGQKNYEHRWKCLL